MSLWFRASPKFNKVWLKQICPGLNFHQEVEKSGGSASCSISGKTNLLRHRSQENTTQKCVCLGKWPVLPGQGKVFYSSTLFDFMNYILWYLFCFGKEQDTGSCQRFWYFIPFSWMLVKRLGHWRTESRNSTEKHCCSLQNVKKFAPSRNQHVREQLS